MKKERGRERKEVKAGGKKNERMERGKKTGRDAFLVICRTVRETPGKQISV
jgi:hypothetical protein